MPKLTLDDLANLENQSSAVTTINNNSASIEAAIENTLSRDGTTPNSMESDLDMNSNSILNLPLPTTDTEPVRKGEFDVLAGSIEEIEQAVAEAQEAAEEAANSADAAAGFVTDAEAAAAEAAQSVIDAAAQAEKFRTQSTTSNTIGNGTKTWTVDTGDYFTEGTYVLIQDNAAPGTNLMFGTVTDYTGDQLEIDVDVSEGSGTYTDWTITLSGARGATGPTGATGPSGEMGGPGVSVDGEIALYDGITGTELKRATTTGLLKASSGVLAAAVADTDYLTPATAASTYQPLDDDLTAIGALAKTDGNIIVGDGSTWVVESGATARTSLGLGTGDSSQFAGVNVGSNNDTTLTRSAAGKLDIEGHTVVTDDEENQGPCTGGIEITSKSLGTISSGTTTLDMADRALQHYTNNGAHTLNPGTVTGTCQVLVTNGASAGAITLSGWTFVLGSALLTTTNTNRFLLSCTVHNGPVSILTILPLQ
jgi:hypothetical protein